MPRIGFVASCSDGGRSGIGQYEINLFRRLVSAGEAHQMVLIAREGSLRHFALDEKRVEIATYPERFSGTLPSIYFHQALLPGIASKMELDLLHLSSQRRLVWRKPCRLVGTIHDLDTYHMPGKYGLVRDKYMRWVGARCAGRLDHVVADSEFTKKDIVDFLGIDPGKITVAYPGIDTDVFKPRDRSECRRIVAEKYGFSAPFIFYVARLDHPGKNHVRLMEAFKRLTEDFSLPHKLVFGGSKWFGWEHIYAAVDRLSLSDRVAFAGFIPNDDLPLFHAAADMLVFPSLFEGFGFPILEAMACGTPVACSNAASLPEIAGDAALLFDPADTEQITQAMLKLLNDRELREDLISKGYRRAARFNWDRTVQVVLQSYDEALSGN